MNQSSFIFKDYSKDLPKGQILFHYALKTGKESFDFTEKLSFPPVESGINQEVLKAVLDSLLIILGVSYWKLYCQKILELPTITLTEKQAQFWNTVYTKGLGEFFYKNKIDFRGLVAFPYSSQAKTSSIPFPRRDRYLLPFGGGKDSIVAAEFLLKYGKPFDLLTLNTSQVQAETASILGKKPILIRREIDPKVFDLNKKGETYNGHIPISAIYAFTSLLAAVLYDHRNIVMSCERSANYGNVEYLGERINHQWSKSLEFEKLFSEYVSTYISPDFRFFSPLRDLSEVKIIEEFVKHKDFFQVFSSCNSNFKIFKPIQGDKKVRWCGKCPKCAFVFTSLAAFLPKEEVLKIFGKNLFEDESLFPIFKQLLGIEGFKPFECVGTPEEMKEAISFIRKRGEFVFPKL